MLFDLPYHFLLPLLFLTGLVAGTVDAIAGGGGLISLPMLLGVGVPPQVALGTNKLQGAIGTFVASYGYYRQGLLSLNTIYKGLMWGIFGTILGAVASQVLNSDILRKIIPLLLLAILIYTIFSPKLGSEDRWPKINEFWFYIFFGFFLGLYDGFFGPGTGSLWVFSLTFFLGYNFVKASAYTKVFNLKSSLIATLCFAFGGNIDYTLALCMAMGQLIGGRIGVYFAIKNGARLIRPIFISVVSTTIITLLYKSYGADSFLRFLHTFGLLPAALFFGVPVISMTILYLRQSKRRRQRQEADPATEGHESI
ncbi:TSUP family transporter [Legionella feeleii]|uniref:Probable membrane transporter protein n=1 Tax=Legionella feeleii TaxID=453 RepID=A0A378IWL4_9GAMM|nr:TSUP family transporter [Legionella feeleii]STX39607.1 Sulfite exporter TauE/SafE [Legionella feeleii]